MWRRRRSFSRRSSGRPCASLRARGGTAITPFRSSPTTAVVFIASPLEHRLPLPEQGLNLRPVLGGQGGKRGPHRPRRHAQLVHHPLHPGAPLPPPPPS